jgi:holo-[acyl-carrier protein] synthase
VIAGVGIDLVEIHRIERMLARFGGRARKKVFTEGEVAYCDGMGRPAQHFAVRFAAKEACFKALTGTEEAAAIGWHDMEVARGAHGEPTLLLHGRAAARAAELRVIRIHLSLTHSDGVAGAVVVVERE